jgi:hypothetical protein
MTKEAKPSRKPGAQAGKKISPFLNLIDKQEVM